MGEYFVLANMAKRQYIDPNVFGEEVKRYGLFRGFNGMATGLLLHTPSPTLPPHPLLSTWLGDNVLLAGDETDATNEWC